MAGPYDVVVIGAGTGGYSAALRAAQLGKKVALVERDSRLGGTCLLRGCIPTKALLQSAAVMDTVTRSGEWGIKAEGEPDWAAVQDFKEKIVAKLVQGVTGLVSARKIDLFEGEAHVVSASEPLAIEVNAERLETTDLVIATGSRPKLLPGVTVSEHVITSDQALGLDRIPASAVVIGSGAVGLEFASMYRSFGSEVTVIEALPRLAPNEDEDVSKEIGRSYRKRKINTAAGARVTSIKETGEGAQVSYVSETGDEKTIDADICLIAIGREPVTTGLGLQEAGIEVDQRGYVVVDGQLRAGGREHVWAVGDVASTPLQLAHVSFAEAYAVAERICGIEVPEIDYADIPRVTYCTPEIASVGLTEAQAREAGLDVIVENLNFRAIGKANIVGEGGFVKVVAEAAGGPVVGVHMVGPHVTDLISEAQLITNWEASAEEVASLIHPHPTLSEAIGEAHMALAGKPLHTP